MTKCKDCPKLASFGYTKREYCHKKDDMIDVKNKRCKGVKVVLKVKLIFVKSTEVEKGVKKRGVKVVLKV